MGISETEVGDSHLVTRAGKIAQLDVKRHKKKESAGLTPL
jgi:hypothetical protein